MNHNLPQIIGVAIYFKGLQYNLPRPKRHHDVIRMIYEINGKGVDGEEKQGFYDNKGRFLDRKEALELARMNGQVKNTQFNQLYSEDLW